MGLNTSGLPQYSQEDINDIMTRIVFGDPILSSGKIKVLKGVKDRRNLNYFTHNVYYQKGKCVATTSGGTDFNQKYIYVNTFTDASTDCIADFEGKYLEQWLKPGATYDAGDYPTILADNLVEIHTKHIGQAKWRAGIENIAGNTLSTQNEGWLYLLKNDYNSDVTKAPAFSGQAPTHLNADAIFLNVLENMHEDVQGAELTCYAGNSFYTNLKRNCFAEYGDIFDRDNPNQFVHPIHSNVTILRDPTMGNTKNFVVTIDGNLAYATDGDGDEDVLEVKEHPTVKNSILKTTIFKMGMEIAMPEYVGIYSWV